MSELTIIGRPKLAAIFEMTVGGLVKMEQRGLPVLKKTVDGNVYHLPTVWQWVKTDQERRLLDTGGGDHKSLSLRRAKAATQRAEIEVAQLDGSLIDVQVVRQGLEGVLVNQRTLAGSVPAQIGREIDDPDLRVRVVAIVERRLNEMLEAMSNYDPLIEPRDDEGGASDADDQDLTPPPPPAPQTPRESVGRAKPVPQPRRRRKRPVAQ